MTAMKNEYKNFFEKYDDKRPFRKPRRRCKINVKQTVSGVWQNQV
jgi:hypothetical protein